MKKLPLSFYEREDVVHIAQELLGKIVATRFGNELTSGRIVETEAYVGFTDRASHSFAGRRSPKNEHMYAAAGTTYIYICYGMHQMLNVVTNQNGIPDAILIRAIEPIAGKNIMAARTGKLPSDYRLTKGPGNVGKALGIQKKHSGIRINSSSISIWDDGLRLSAAQIGISKRIGVDSAGVDALLPYRFFEIGNKYVSAHQITIQRL